MDTNYRIAYDKGWQDLQQKDPAEVARNMDVRYIEEQQQFVVPFLNETYTLDLKHQTITRKSDGQAPGIETAILILHYLSFFQSLAEPAHKWVSLKEIPNGGSLFYPAFHKTAIQGLIKAYGQRPQLLLEYAPRLGGQSAAFGDASAVFQVFPKIPLCAVIWEGDEEIAANATILFDPSIAHFLHIESVIGLGGYLANKLIKLTQDQ